MSRYSPTVTPDYGENYGDIIASGIEQYLGAKRKEKADTRADEEYEYTKHRHETLDPLEDALLRARLYESGVVPDEAGGSGLPAAIEGERGGPPNRGADLISGRAKFGDQGLQTGQQPTSGGLFAPGSFNPTTGGFNPPMDPGFTARPGLGGSRPPNDRGFAAPEGTGGSRPTGDRDFSLGGGYHIDQSRTPEGRKESQLARQIDAAVRSGIPRDEAELEIRGGGISSEHFHPGQFHPKTRAEYDAIEQQQHKYRLEEIGAREAALRRGKKDTDPRWDERRKTWVKQLGEPSDEMEQDILDALASGYTTEEIVETMPASRKSRAQRYLRRAARKEQRGAAPEPE
jgi:hypothetical protein